MIRNVHGQWIWTTSWGELPNNRDFLFEHTSIIISTSTSMALALALALPIVVVVAAAAAAVVAVVVVVISSQQTDSTY